MAIEIEASATPKSHTSAVLRTGASPGKSALDRAPAPAAMAPSASGKSPIADRPRAAVHPWWSAGNQSGAPSAAARNAQASARRLRVITGQKVKSAITASCPASTTSAAPRVASPP